MTDLLRENAVLIAMAVVMIGAWLLLRSRATPFESSTSLDRMTGAGQPVVLEFFSNA